MGRKNITHDTGRYAMKLKKLFSFNQTLFFILIFLSHQNINGMHNQVFPLNNADQQAMVAHVLLNGGAPEHVQDQVPEEEDPIDCPMAGDVAIMGSCPPVSVAGCFGLAYLIQITSGVNLGL